MLYNFHDYRGLLPGSSCTRLGAACPGYFGELAYPRSAKYIYDYGHLGACGGY